MLDGYDVLWKQNKKETQTKRVGDDKEITQAHPMQVNDIRSAHLAHLYLQVKQDSRRSTVSDSGITNLV